MQDDTQRYSHRVVVGGLLVGVAWEERVGHSWGDWGHCEGWQEDC